MLRINQVNRNLSGFKSVINDCLLLFKGGGNVKIESRKVDIKATSRIEAKNDAYVPRGGEKKVSKDFSRKYRKIFQVNESKRP